MNGFDFSQDVDSNIYFKTLCSSGLAFLSKQPQLIDQKRNALLDTKRKLVYNNYDSFIKFSAFSKDLIDDFHQIEETLNEIDNTLPVFKSKCQDFSQNAKKISSRWADVSSMLSKYPQLIEFLEIPQLLNNCIRTFYYEDAIKILNVVSKICIRNKDVSIIFANMLEEIEKSKTVMINQILKELNGNVQLPVCIKMVDYLRRTDRFNEQELRVNFLLARDVWFKSSLQKNAFNLYSLNHISNITEVFRINLFDIVTQYRAIFPDLESDLKAPKEINSKIINSWLMIKTEQYLKILQKNLDSFVSHKSALPLETVIDHCFYFGLSMSKVGAEIRPKLVAVFNEFIKQRCLFLVKDCDKNFESSMSSIFKSYKKKTDLLETTFETQMQDFPAIFNYFNQTVAILEEMSKIVPLSLVSYVVDTLNASLMHVSDTLQVYIDKHKFGLNPDEWAILVRFAHCCQHQMLPGLSARFQSMFSISSISKTFGITNTNLSEMGLAACFELDIKTPSFVISELLLNCQQQ